jgi:hypothetical protein
MTVTFAKALIALTALVVASCGVSVGPTLDEGARNADTVTLPPAAPTIDTVPPTDTVPPVAPPADTDPPDTATIDTVPTVGAIERTTVTAPGYVAISGWAQGSEPNAPVALTAWLDGTAIGTGFAEPMPDAAAPRFVFDLRVAPGGHVACVTPATTSLDTPLDCVDLDMEPAAEMIVDGTILLTAVEPDPIGSISVRGVITGSEHPEWIDVTTETATRRVDVDDGAFRFDLQGLADSTYHLCPNPFGVTIGTGPADPSTTCGTAIVGPLSIGTTGRAATIDSVAPAVDHPLHLMERDGGVSVELTDGSTLWFFGDTTDDITGERMSYFVNNTAAWASADAPTTTRDVAAARPVLFAAPPPGTCTGAEFGDAALWPESAVALPQEDGTDRVVVVMSKVCVGDNWLDIETAGFAVVEYRYDPTDPPIDDPIRGEVTQPHLADADAGYGRALLHEPDGFLYGYECGTFPDDWGPCHVGRVRPEQVTDPTAWRYWNGGDRTDPRSWSPNETAAQAMELPGDAETALPVAAFGVTYDEVFDTHLMVYSPWPGFCNVLAIRASDTPVGPWTDAVEITFPGCGATDNGVDEYCYAATPQMQLCEHEMFAGGYYDMTTDEGAARYYTFAAPLVVVHDR